MAGTRSGGAGGVCEPCGLGPLRGGPAEDSPRPLRPRVSPAVSTVVRVAVASPSASPSLHTLCRSLDVLPDNHKFKQLQRELSQVLTQRQVYIQPDN